MRRSLVQAGVATALLLGSMGPAEAYIGPGAGITAIGTAIALISAIALAIVGFVWYPVKRLRAKIRNKRNPAKGPDAKDPHAKDPHAKDQHAAPSA